MKVLLLFGIASTTVCLFIPPSRLSPFPPFSVILHTTSIAQRRSTIPGKERILPANLNSSKSVKSTPNFGLKTTAHFVPSNEGHFEPNFFPEKRVVCVFWAPLIFWARFSLCRARPRRRRPTRRTHRPRLTLTRRDKRERRRKGGRRDGKEGGGTKGGRAKLQQFSHFSSRYRDSSALHSVSLTCVSHTSNSAAPISPIWPSPAPMSPSLLPVAIAPSSMICCSNLFEPAAPLGQIPYWRRYLRKEEIALLRTRRAVNSLVFAGRGQKEEGNRRVLSFECGAQSLPTS